jgi:hypothetical protein
MWNVRIKMMAVMNRGNWNHSRITQTIPENLPRKQDIKELQITAILCSALILWKVLM